MHSHFEKSFFLVRLISCFLPQKLNLVFWTFEDVSLDSEPVTEIGHFINQTVNW